jgi:tRNA-Thr(GGU) m(6)t(6)A37 methyltransferase TsaA
MNVEAIGTIHSSFHETAGTPIQPAMASGARGRVEVFPQFRDGLKDLEGFDRVWLIYWFDRAAGARLRVVPFLDTEERGVFATRAPCRPNPIGLSPVRLLSIQDGVLEVADVDVLDGTPLLDIKPYTPRFDHFDVRRSGWLDSVHHGHCVADDRFAAPSEPESK